MAKQAPFEPDDASSVNPSPPPKYGSAIRVGKQPPAEKNPKDKGVFTQEDLQKYGGWMKEPPTDPMPKPVKKAKGGKIDGCAQRGKTRGKVV